MQFLFFGIVATFCGAIGWHFAKDMFKEDLEILSENGWKQLATSFLPDPADFEDGRLVTLIRLNDPTGGLVVFSKDGRHDLPLWVDGTLVVYQATMLPRPGQWVPVQFPSLEDDEDQADDHEEALFWGGNDIITGH